MRAAGATRPHRQNVGAQIQMGVMTMGKKQEIAIGIALQTQVLKTCPIHNQLYRDAEEATEDENMARAFAVAIELVRQHKPYAVEFNHDAHLREIRRRETRFHQIARSDRLQETPAAETLRRNPCRSTTIDRRVLHALLGSSIDTYTFSRQ
jgi:hypothetical protein